MGRGRSDEGRLTILLLKSSISILHIKCTLIDTFASTGEGVTFTQAAAKTLPIERFERCFIDRNASERRVRSIAQGMNPMDRFDE